MTSSRVKFPAADTIARPPGALGPYDPEASPFRDIDESLGRGDAQAMLSVTWCAWCQELIKEQPTRLHSVPFHWRCLKKRRPRADLTAEAQA